MRSCTLLGLSLVLLSACSSKSDGGDDDTANLFAGYGTKSVGLPVKLAMTPLTPVSPAPSITGYSVKPDLPAGVTLDTTTGVISGTPDALTAQKTYSITAKNSNGKKDVETLKILVRGPILGLASDVPLVRSFAAPGTPIGMSRGGVSSATAGTSLFEPASSIDATPLPADDEAVEPTGVVTVDPGAPLPGTDQTVDFVATIALDASELSGDPWTIAVQAPYDDDGLVPAATFPFDTATVVVEDGALQLEAELAAEMLGPFDSEAIPTRRLDHEPVLQTADGVTAPWILHEGAFYFGYSSASDASLVRFDPDAAGGPELVELVDINPGASDDPTPVGIFDGGTSGEWLVAQLRTATASRLFAFDLTSDTLVEVGSINGSGTFVAEEVVEFGGELYLTSTDSTPQRFVMRWTPPEASTPASLERISYTAGAASLPDEARDLTPRGGMLYFTAVDGGGGRNLYRFDPSVAEQERLSEAAQADVDDLVLLDGTLYMTAAGPGGRKVFRWDDGAEQLVQIADTAGSSTSDDPELHGDLSGGLHFSAVNAGGDRKLFLYDPSSSTLRQIGDTAGVGADDGYVEFERVGDELLIVAEDAGGFTKLFAYDYTADSIRQVADVNGPGVDDQPRGLVALPDGRVAMSLFSTAAGGHSLYVYAPGAPGLSLVADPSGAGVDDDVRTLGVLGDRLYFSADDGAGGVDVFELE